MTNLIRYNPGFTRDRIEKMSISLDKTYDPTAVQDEIAALWKRHNAFHAEPDTSCGAKPYVIVIPPPNVTAALHMGHALNNTIQDVLIRWRRMAGDNAVWIPGTDHAGIATQTVVDKRLQAEGQPALKEYKQLEAEGKGGREQFIGKVTAWKDEYEARITEQLVRMGCSCDFDRQRFTMDDTCARAVREAFFELFKAGLIYRGKRLVNWDPVTQTALADDEVEMETVDGHFWYMKYPLVPEGDDQSDGCDSGEAAPIRNPKSEIEYVTVATTRPETMLGDTAVAVNPDDPERAKFIGRHVRLPIVNRVIPVVGDDYVVKPDPESSDEKAKFASGFLKVTPAHDPNDYDIGQRHSLAIINVMAPDASISRDHGWPAEEWESQTPLPQLGERSGEGDGSPDASPSPAGGAQSANGSPSPQPSPSKGEGVGTVDPFAHELLGMDRYEAREAIVTWFREHDLLADVRPYSHSVGHSYRSHVAVEPYLSDQWYVKVTDDRLAGAALDAMTPDQRSDSAGPAWKDGKSFTKQDGELKFFPARYAKTFQAWHENIRDWCISRQLWWGHRIPVWTYQLSESAVRFLETGEGDPAQALTAGDNAAQDFIAGNLLDKPTSLAVPIEDRPKHVSMGEGEKGRALGFPWPKNGHFTICIRDADVERKAESLGFVRDPDVLDTWFSSGLWPISTLGWPVEEGNDVLNTWNPSSTLCTAREIITLWVSRMVMFNVFFRGCLPFRDVFIHAMIQDGEGQKMSKSLGNGVDPLDIIHSHGADAMRYTLAAMTTQTQDVKMPVDTVCPHCSHAFTPKWITTNAGHVVAAPTQDCPECGKPMTTSYGVASGTVKATDDAPAARNTSSKFDQGRNFANKIWNAARFVLTNLDNAAAESGRVRDEDVADRPFELGLDDRWILSRLARTINTIDEALAAYRFNDYAQALYDFIWRDFCDWYVEATKLRVRNNDGGGLAARAILSSCLDAALRLMHPAMPFLSEKLFAELNAVIGETDANRDGAPKLCITSAWPSVTNAAVIDPDVEAAFELLQETIVEVRNVRNKNGVKPRDRVTVRIKADGNVAATLRIGADLIATLATCDVAAIGPDEAASDDAATAVMGKVEIYVEGLIDAGAEKDRLTKQLADLEKSRNALSGRLNNKGYVDKAPPHLVEQTREQLAQTERDIENVRAKLDALGV
ncbi:MAG: valine--tRNA ligase [Phycisphaera sp.]|nr:valine--tRNA ligase [Phycisphaera sp.]